MSWQTVLKVIGGDWSELDVSRHYEFAIKNLKVMLEGWPVDEYAKIIQGPTVLETDKDTLVVEPVGAHDTGSFLYSPKGSKDYVYSPLRFVTNRPIEDWGKLRKVIRQEGYTAVSNKGGILTQRYGSDLPPNAMEYFIRPNQKLAKEIRDKVNEKTGKTKQQEMEEQGHFASFPDKPIPKARMEKHKEERNKLGINSFEDFIRVCKEEKHRVLEMAFDKNTRVDEWFKEDYGTYLRDFNTIMDSTLVTIQNAIKELNVEGTNFKLVAMEEVKNTKDSFKFKQKKKMINDWQELMDKVIDDKPHMEMVYKDYVAYYKPFNNIFINRIGRLGFREVMKVSLPKRDRVTNLLLAVVRNAHKRELEIEEKRKKREEEKRVYNLPESVKARKEQKAKEALAYKKERELEMRDKDYNSLSNRLRRMREKRRKDKQSGTENKSWKDTLRGD